MLVNVRVGDVVKPASGFYTYKVLSWPDEVEHCTVTRVGGGGKELVGVPKNVFVEIVERAPIRVGDKVVIKPESTFYGKSRLNPADVEGEVVSLNGAGFLPVTVRWPMGENSYGVEDLTISELVDGQAPTPKVKKEKKKHPTKVALIKEAVGKVKGGTDTANFCVIHDHKVVKSETTACHAWLSSYYIKTETKNIQWVVSSINRGIDAHPEFYKWLIDESVWAPAFHYRYRWSKSNRCVVMNTDVAANFMVSALIASRIPWENPDKARIAMEMKSLGVPGEFALFLSSGSYKEGDGKWSIGIRGMGHWPFHSGYDNIEVVKGMFTRQLQGLQESYRVVKSYDNVNDLFGEGNYDPTLFKDLEKETTTGTWGQQITKNKPLTDEQLLEWVDKVRKEVV